MCVQQLQQCPLVCCWKEWHSAQQQLRPRWQSVKCKMYKQNSVATWRPPATDQEPASNQLICLQLKTHDKINTRVSTRSGLPTWTQGHACAGSLRIMQDCIIHTMQAYGNKTGRGDSPNASQVGQYECWACAGRNCRDVTSRHGAHYRFV